MYVLNTFKYESAHECESTAFPTYDRAYHEMVRQLEECAASEGIDLAEKVKGDDLMEEDGCEVGSLDEMDASIWDVCCWVINEVPGLFIPQGDAWFISDGVKEINKAKTHFDATEIALEVCGRMKKYV